MEEFAGQFRHRLSQRRRQTSKIARLLSLPASPIY